MQKIIPHLWFDKEAVEAATWYVSLFENSKIIGITTLPETPSGDAEMVDFGLEILMCPQLDQLTKFVLFYI
ncbi:MAG: hypothetical protein K0S61_3493 [Anaerocolumna sp.]|jgi:predicted 3-demethylubiquinone-9 3-methyltransferase (glyoxalase superfamily)|nr:hypothetical protein [Anaerocolumna sp.]